MTSVCTSKVRTMTPNNIVFWNIFMVMDIRIIYFYGDIMKTAITFVWLNKFVLICWWCSDCKIIYHTGKWIRERFSLTKHHGQLCNIPERSWVQTLAEKPVNLMFSTVFLKPSTQIMGSQPQTRLWLFNSLSFPIPYLPNILQFDTQVSATNSVVQQTTRRRYCEKDRALYFETIN